MENRLTITDKGVFLNGIEIKNCTNANLENINMDGTMEVILHIIVSQADVKYGFKQTE